MKAEAYIQKMMLTPLDEVIKIADREFQLMRRMECADENGIVKCICCDIRKHYKRMDGGHFIPRQHLGTRYHPLNVWGQSKHCNKWLSGNHAKYRDSLVKKLGKEAVEEMEQNKDLTPKNWREFVIETIIHSRKNIKFLKKSIL